MAALSGGGMFVFLIKLHWLEQRYMYISKKPGRMPGQEKTKQKTKNPSKTKQKTPFQILVSSLSKGKTEGSMQLMLDTLQSSVKH